MNRNKKKAITIGAISGFINGLFGAAGGTVLVPCMERLLGYRAYKAHASAIAVILPISLISGLIYFENSNADIWKTAFIIIGGMIGGIIGAKILKKISAVWLHRIFGLFMCIAAVKMIL